MATWKEHQAKAAAAREAERARRRGDVDPDLVERPVVKVPCTFCLTPCISIDPTPKCRACLGGN